MPQPTIPEKIVVHLGSPNSEAQNVTESFADYIKNVASSEIYPTWPEEAIKANVLAQISVALNRVYTEYYRSMGKDFDITSSPAYDQTYIFGRDIFENVSRIVDEVFDSYIRREGFVEPLYAQFCDGIELTCPGLLQWGSVELAESGLNYEQILKNYYGDNIEIVKNVPVENVDGTAPPVPIVLGDTGRDVELIQRKLNRISENFPGIPKIQSPDGFFGEDTLAAVKKFQEVFNLGVDGKVGHATWYKIQFAYNGVKRLSEISSEGIRLSDIDTRFSDTLTQGDSGDGVLALQYYLSYISLFVPTVSSVSYDGAFGELTANAVRSFQKTYGLPETAVVDRLTWDSIENVYYGILREMDYKFKEGAILPFPGRVLRQGIEGDDVRALQEYLNYIARVYTSIPTVDADGDFGNATALQVKAFKSAFGYNNDNERVTPQIWNAITSVYDDLYESESPAMASVTESKAKAHAYRLSPKDTGEDVIILSSMIKQLEEYYWGVSDIRISSYYGENLVRSIRAIRRILLLGDADYADEELLIRLDKELRAIRKEKSQ